MSDFERAVARLKEAGDSGISVDRSNLVNVAKSERPDEGLERLQVILRQKLNEPVDVILQDDETLSFSAEARLTYELSRGRVYPAVSPMTDTSHVGSSVASSSANFGDQKTLNQEIVELEKPASHEASSYKRLEISFSSLAERGFITPATAKGQLTEEYRRIKRPLIKHIEDAVPGNQRNVIMVTSSVQGEGKTYSSINLAISLAQEKNRSVLLIDADVVKGTAGRELGAKGDEAGLLDLLSEAYTHPSEVIMNTNIPGLNFMPAGKADDNANELLTSARMRNIINRLARESNDRVVILDCPPILQTNEAHVLADYADQIVFVVAEQQTSQPLVQEALSYLENEKFVGILLNKSSRVGAGYGYGNGYYQ